jgi:anti-sigma B factor antagonist
MSASNHSTVSSGWDQPDEFHVAEEPLGPRGVLLTVTGELDIATAPELRRRLAGVIDAGARRLVIDLTSISFMDSVAMAAILHARKLLADGGRMGIVLEPDSYTRIVFEIAGLPRCLDLFGTREEAVVHVGS